MSAATAEFDALVAGHVLGYDDPAKLARHMAGRTHNQPPAAGDEGDLDGLTAAHAAQHGITLDALAGGR